MTAYTTLNKDLSNFVTEVLDYLVVNEIDHQSSPPFKQLGNVATLGSDIPSLNTVLDEFSLSFKNIFIYTIFPFETVVSSPGQYIIIPLLNYADSSFSINEPKPDAVLQESVFYDLGYYDADDTIELNRANYEANTLYLFNSNVWTGVKYLGDDMPLFLCAAVNEDLSSYFSE